MTKIWVTRYALTAGVFAVEAKISNHGTMATYRRQGRMFNEYAHGNDFHLTEEDAKARFLEMKAKKQASLQKQLTKAAAAEFTVTNL